MFKKKLWSADLVLAFISVDVLYGVAHHLSNISWNGKC
jgi:hypothetical protein